MRSPLAFYCAVSISFLSLSYSFLPRALLQFLLHHSWFPPPPLFPVSPKGSPASPSLPHSPSLSPLFPLGRLWCKLTYTTFSQNHYCYSLLGRPHQPSLLFPSRSFILILLSSFPRWVCRPKRCLSLSRGYVARVLWLCGCCATAFLWRARSVVGCCSSRRVCWCRVAWTRSVVSFGVCRFAVSSRVVSKACLITYVQMYVSAVC